MTPIFWTLTAALAVGLIAGAFHFTGLWWTVRRLEAARRPALAMMTSFTLRTAVVLMAFYFAGQRHWTGFPACMAGFLLARRVIMRRLLPPIPPDHRRADADGRLPATMDG